MESSFGTGSDSLEYRDHGQQQEHEQQQVQQQGEELQQQEYKEWEPQREYRDGDEESDGSATRRLVTIASFMNLSDMASMASEDEWIEHFHPQQFHHHPHHHQQQHSQEQHPQQHPQSGFFFHDDELVHGQRAHVGGIIDMGIPRQGFPLTPHAPGLVAVSPKSPSLVAMENRPESYDTINEESSVEDNDEEEEEEEHSVQAIGRKWAQARLASAVFSHPQPLRHFCLDAFLAARQSQQRRREMQMLRQQQQEEMQNNQAYEEDEKPSPETLVEPCNDRNRKQQRNRKRARNRHDNHTLNRHLHLVHAIVDKLFLPVSVAGDVLGGFRELSLDTSFAIVRVSAMTAQGVVDVAVHIVFFAWDVTVTCITSPFAILQGLSEPFHTTTEVVVSGIQSVTTNVGSASSTLLRITSSSKAHFFPSSQVSSRQSLGQLTGVGTAGGPLSSLGNNIGAVQQQQLRSLSKSINHKLLRKLSSLNSAASVISYHELADDAGGLSRHAKNRVQRMMHYDVSLRPFVATVKLPPVADTAISGPSSSKFSSTKDLVGSADNAMTDSERAKCHDTLERKGSRSESLSPSFCNSPSTSSSSSTGSLDNMSKSDASSALDLDDESPFMCTPQSFPPTPASRRMVLARGTRFADDVVFLARDQLRVHDGLASSNARTREMAQALTQGKRLAVFDADDASVGIELTCGQHVATKVMGSMLYYCSARSMVPILRNCCVYFEMTVLPPPSAALPSGASNSMAMLSIGLSTKEMPPNTLVGAWKGSVGLCSTGQLLTAGQWCSPVDPTKSAYGTPAAATAAAGDTNKQPPSTTTTTVGCLVCLDDASAFETWDGVMVTAAVTFTVNEQPIVSPTNTPAVIIPNNNLEGRVGVEVGMDTTSTTTGPWLQQLPRTNQSSMGDPNQPYQRPPPPPLPHQQQQIQEQTVASPKSGVSGTSKLSSPPRCCFTLPLLVPAEEELYPTATLHSPGTAVMCRFSAGDVLATSREPLGVPKGVTIYAVDGSVIFE